MEPVNLGSSFEISISDLAIKISKIMKYNGKIEFDKSKPDGQPRRKLDTSLAFKEFGFKSKVTFLKVLKIQLNGTKKIMQKYPKVSIIITNYNGGKFFLIVLNLLKKLTIQILSLF